MRPSFFNPPTVIARIFRKTPVSHAQLPDKKQPDASERPARQQKPLVIGIAGFGTVGGGLCEAIRANREFIIQRTGRDIAIKTIVVRNPGKTRRVPFPAEATIATSLEALYSDPEIDVVVELMGGIKAPQELIIHALKAGKHVVTANKALLAEEGEPLFAEAAANNRILGYEASVCGAIPVVGTFKQALAGNRIKELVGILNGTSNYILSEMSSKGLPFDKALSEAQALGYAEADPTLDIEGIDAAHKLSLLIRLAFGLNYPFKKLPVHGIAEVEQMDIQFAREFGYRIKLLGQARNVDGRLEAGVFPTLVHHTLLIARVGGAYNAVRADGNVSGPIFLHGLGAGDLPTGSAVLSDIMAIARGFLPDNTGFSCRELPEANILPPEEAVSRYYLRCMVPDTPGVLRDLAGAMAEFDISVAQAIQKTDVPAKSLPIVFMTHQAKTNSMRAAIARMNEKGLLLSKPVYYRVL